MTGSNKYKYYVQHDGTNWVAVTLVKPAVISGKKDSQSYRYARKSSVWKMIRYENGSAYDALKALIAHPSLLANEILVKCELWDAWTTLTEVVYQGYIPISGISINEDNGVLEITPSEKSDYDWYDQHKGDKVDVYNSVIGTYEKLGYLITTTTEEYYIPDSMTYFIPNGFFDAGQVKPALWVAGTSYVTGWYTNSWCRTIDGSVWHCIQNNTSSTANFPPSVNWEYMGSHATFVAHAVRQTCDLPFWNGSDTFIQGNDDYELGFPAVTTEDNTKNNLPRHKWYYALETQQTGYMVLCGTTIPGLNVVSTGANHGMLDILQHLLQIDNYQPGVQFTEGSGLTFHSLFFSEATNPVSGTANKFTNPRLVHNRVMKGIQDIETSGEMTLDNLLRDLCETLQLGWSIIGTDFYIEHVDYFENGFSYTVPPVVYTDLTNTTNYPLKYQVVHDPDGSESDNDYKFSLSDCPEKETFSFPDGYDYNGQIKYDSKFAKKGEALEHNVSTFMTDFAYVIAYRIDSVDDSWCLIAAGEPTLNNTGIVWRRTTGIRWVQGPITVLGVAYTDPPYFRRNETDYPNGDLMWNNILKDWWVMFPIFQTGGINGATSSTFDAVEKRYKRIKKQREIRFPRLGAGAFDPYKLITTNVGDGRIETFEIDTDTDFIKVELLYEES